MQTSRVGDMPGFVEIPPTGRDRDLTRLTAFLVAERRAEVWTSRRTLFGRIVVGLSVPMGLFVYQGANLRSLSVRLVLTGWILALASLIACAAGAAIAAREVEGVLKRVGGRHVDVEE
jgi:hypothetical protein